MAPRKQLDSRPRALRNGNDRSNGGYYGRSARQPTLGEDRKSFSVILKSFEEQVDSIRYTRAACHDGAHRVHTIPPTYLWHCCADSIRLAYLICAVARSAPHRGNI